MFPALQCAEIHKPQSKFWHDLTQVTGSLCHPLTYPAKKAPSHHSCTGNAHCHLNNWKCILFWWRHRCSFALNFQLLNCVFFHLDTLWSLESYLLICYSYISCQISIYDHKKLMLQTPLTILYKITATSFYIRYLLLFKANISYSSGLHK